MKISTYSIRLRQFIILFFIPLAIQAQELTVKSMQVADMDLSASTYPRNDKNGNPCALVKVQLAAVGAQFEGNVLGNAEYKAGEYWVYMSQGSYMLKVKHPNFVPLDVNFRDYDIRGVQPKTTYVLTLLMPQPMQEVKKQKLVINYTPVEAMVLIDSKPYSGRGRVEAELQLGEHSYVIAANGYVTAEGTVKLNGGGLSRTLNEHLEKDNATVVPQQVTTQAPLTTQSTVIQSTTAATNTTNDTVETFTVEGVSFRMVRVEGGTFLMGSKDSKAESDEKPMHLVTLSTYSIGETEVTQELWQAVMGSNPSYFKGAKRPVEKVSWEDCQQFIQKLNQLTGKRFRLPTEAEWEYAARGGNKSKGYKYAGGNDIGSVAWYSGNSGNATHDVATKQANELGLYDMSGNVYEWCQDWYGKYTRGAQTNPTGPQGGSIRVYRGGSWGSSAGDCRSSYRFGNAPSYIGGFLGLRLAL